MPASPLPHRAKDHYAARLAELTATFQRLEAQANRISALRGVTFLCAAIIAGTGLFRPLPLFAWILTALFAASFIGLVIMHAVLISRSSAAKKRMGLAERGLARIKGDLGVLSQQRGERFLIPGHAYLGDLDIFGASSIFQLVNASETGAAARVLAGWLSFPASAREVEERSEAARELAEMRDFREELSVEAIEAGAKDGLTEPLALWAEGRVMVKDSRSEVAPTRAPDLNMALVRTGQALVVLTVGLLVAGEILGREMLGPWKNLWLIPFLGQIVVLGLLRPALEPILMIVSSAEAPFARYAGMLRRIEAQTFESKRLVKLSATLRGQDGREASRAFEKLQRIVGYAELRHSGFVHLLANLFLLWDVFSASALDKWRSVWGERVTAWLEALAEIEALASLGTYTFEHPSYVFAEVDDGPPHFEAEGLGHPLIAEERRVDNDVNIGGPARALFVSGSNMSGKSTLLRAIGVNTVLALAGAPVCARRLSVATCHVQTSMRISDSLEAGVSHFYAEIERLKGVVDSADRGEKVLFLLDEILHGTNSRERIIGAKAVVKHLLDKDAIGAVSSHDLGLASLAEESEDRVVNVHLEESVADGKMTFDYKLKPGVVASANALRLMKMVGLAVDLPES